MINKIIYTILGIILAWVFLPSPVRDLTNHSVVSGASTEQINLPPPNAAPEIASTLPVPQLSAKSVLALDLNSGTILYSKNLDEQLPIASLTKLMTALVVMKNKNLTDTIIVGKRDQGVIGNNAGLVAGEILTVDSLLHALLISSSNDAAVTLADGIVEDQTKFADLMNAQAKSMGLNNTHFANPVGWDSDENYSTTLDLVKIVKEFLKNESLKKIVQIKQMNISSVDGKRIHELLTTNKLLLENPEVVGIKTGFTSKAFGNLIILTNHQSSQVLTIVLGSENREQDTRELLDWLFQVYRW